MQGRREAPGGQEAAVGLLRIHVEPALPDPQRGLERFGDPGGFCRAQPQTVLDHLQDAAARLVNPRVSLAFEQGEHLGLGEVGRHGDGKGDHQPRIAGRPGALDECRPDALRRVAPHRRPAAAAMQHRRPGEQQLQVIVQFRHRPDRGARGAHGIVLIDGDRRWNALDAVHQGLVHPVEKLAGVGGEGLDVAALPFRVEGVEDQGGLAGTADAGHDNEFAERQVEVETF